MRKLSIIFAFVLAVPLSASAYCDMVACTSSVTVDSGQTGKMCDRSGSSCECVLLPSDCQSPEPMASCTSGGYGWHVNNGTMVNGLICCGYRKRPGEQCLSQQTAKEQIETTTDQSLENTFEAQIPEFTDVYYGFVNGVNRSPNLGRANSIHARLDICLDGTDVDAVTASGWNAQGEQSCETYCGNSHNEYCNNNTATVCKDRCACLYKYNNSNLSLTCNNL
jgi:hypothetical protein